MTVAVRRNYLLAPVVALATAGCTSVPTTEAPVYLMLTDIEARLIRASSSERTPHVNRNNEVTLSALPATLEYANVRFWPKADTR